MNTLIDKLRQQRRLSRAEYTVLLDNADDSVRQYAAQAAREETLARFGNGVYIRGLIEIGSYCRNDCLYCGLRRSNASAERYRLSQEQILACCRANATHFSTFVLQGGEDPALSDKAVEEVLRAIRSEFPSHAITLSLGERSAEALQRFHEAGADRYLLRHETADPAHYAQLHPAPMSFESRMACLHTLQRLGYQTGTGMMVGSPGQQIGHLVEDLLFIERFRPQMIGIGPFLPQRDTPLGRYPAGDIDRTLLLISLLRLMFPHALIPSTTALASLASDGRERGILAGANVVMPNLSPTDVRAKYAIYDHKRALGAESAEGLPELEARLRHIGYRIDGDRGDYHEENS